MKLRTLRVDGFGRLAGRTFAFGPGLNVVVGPNEAGKSTLAAAIVASLYGLQRGEKDRWRPWTGNAYATALSYETADGATWEVHRALERDTKGVRVFDAAGADAAARLGQGKTLSPGEAHLQIPLEVYLQTACARQRAVALESGTADEVSAALAHALGGGPKEDAALGALDDAAFEALRAACAQAEAARSRAAAASSEAAAARRDGEGGRSLNGGLVAAALAGTLADVGVAVAHLWLWTMVAGAVALVLALAAFRNARTRLARRREADAKQHLADAALASESAAANAVAGVLEPLGIATMDELARRRERLRALTAREAAAQKAQTRALTARAAALAEAARFDALAGALVPDVAGERETRRAAAARAVSA